jgi:adenine-specific DNA methylase
MECAGSTLSADENSEAVPNSVRGAKDSHYEDKVALCLSESRRALSPRGRLILTFHNNDLYAWRALSQALIRARFDIVALAMVAAENSADHSKRGKHSFLSDLVIECRPRQMRRRRPWKLAVQGVASNAERKNLEAIGLSLAECVNRREGDIEVLFDQHMNRLKARKRLIHRGGT